MFKIVKKLLKISEQLLKKLLETRLVANISMTTAESGLNRVAIHSGSLVNSCQCSILKLENHAVFIKTENN